MDKVNKNSLMEMFMKGNFIMEKDKDKEYLKDIMVNNIKEVLKMISLMVKVSINGLMVIFMKVIFKMVHIKLV